MTSPTIFDTLDALLGEKPPTNGAPSKAGGTAEFVAQYEPLARKVGATLGVEPEVLLGQWGLETGWGKSVIPGTNNLGNIKDFSGKGVQATDNQTGSRDGYRKYDDGEAFGQDFARLIGGSSRYRGALNAGANAQSYFAALKQGGYAEDPGYVGKGVAAAKMAAQHLGQTPEQAPSQRYYDGHNQPLAGVAPPPPAASFVDKVKDTGIALGSGLLSGGQMLANTFGADNAVSEALGSASKELDSHTSPERQAERQARQQQIKHAELYGTAFDEIVANVGAFADAPLDVTVNALGSSAPVLLSMFIPGANATVAARLIVGGAMGAAQGMGAAKGSIYEAVEQKLKDSGIDSDTAKKTAAGAQAYDSQNGGMIAANGALGVIAAITGADKSLAKILSRKVADEAAKRAAAEPAKGLLKSAGIGVAKEAPIEASQGGLERTTSNVALQNAGFDTPTFQGAAGQMTLEGLASSGLGAAGGIAERGAPAVPPNPPPNPVAAKAAEPNSPLSRAALAGNPDLAATSPPAATAADPITQRAAEIETAVRDGKLLEKLRATGQPTTDLLGALAAAKNPGVEPRLRQKALDDLEQGLRTAQVQGATQAGQAWQDLGVTQPADDLAAQKAASESANVAGQAWQDLGITHPADELQQQRGEATAQRLTEAGRQWQDIKPIGTPAWESSVLPVSQPQEQAHGAEATQAVEATQEGSPAPAAEQPVAEAPVARRQVEAPKVATPRESDANRGTAQVRQRRAQLEAMRADGFDAVERRSDGFWLVNHASNSEMRLDNAGDAARASAGIQAYINEAAHQSPNSPKNDKTPSSKAQIDAGNAPKPSVKRFGLTIRVENPSGSTRSGVSPEGKPWSTTMAQHYGEVERTEGADGDPVDAFLGDGHRVFVIDQNDPKTGLFDEHKIMLGFRDEAEARRAYLANYEKGWQGLGAITEMSVPVLRKWVRSDLAKKPASQKIAATTAATTNDQAARDIQADAAAVASLREATGHTEDAIELADPSSPLTQALDALLDAMAKLTGHRGIAVKWTGKGAPDGAYTADTNRFVVNADRPDMHVAQTIGHEFKHLTERYPGLAKLYDRMWALIPQEARRAYFEGYLFRKAGAKYAEATPQQLALLEKEMLADFMGQRFNDRAWLEQLAKQKPALFGEFVADWIKLLNELIGELKALIGVGNVNKDVDRQMRAYQAELEAAKVVAMEVATAWAERNPKMAQSTGAADAIQHSAKADYDLDVADMGAYPDAEMQSQLQDELAQEAKKSSSPSGDVEDADIQSHGMMAEEAYPGLHWNDTDGTGTVFQAKIPDLYENGKTAALTLEKELSGLFGATLRGTWLGPSENEKEGYVTRQAAEDFTRRFVASKDLAKRGFDLAETIEPKQAKALVKLWKKVGQADDARRYDKVGEDSLSLDDIARDMGLLNTHRIKFDRDPTGPGSETIYTVFTDIKTDAEAGTVAGRKHEASLDINTVGGKKIATAHTGGMGRGGLGAAFYQLMSEYAAGHDIQIAPDYSLSGINAYRRTEQQLSAALRTGNSTVMVPHPAQRIHGFESDASTPKQHDANIVRMLLAGLRNAREIVPRIEGLDYDAKTGEFLDFLGDNANDYVKDLLADVDVRAFGFGRSTLARAAMTRMILDDALSAGDVKSFKEPVLYSAKEEEESRGVIGEVAPHPEQAVAQEWDAMTDAEKQMASRNVAGKIVQRVFDDMGLNGWSADFSSGSWNGKVNPNFILAAPATATQAEIDEVARVLGYVFDQQAIVAFDESNTESAKMAGFVKVVLPDGMPESKVAELRNWIGQHAPRAGSDTLRGGALVFGNFTAFDEGQVALSDAEYRKQVFDAVNGFEPNAWTIVVTPVRRSHSELIWPGSRNEYLEGTRYGGDNTTLETGRDDLRVNEGRHPDSAIQRIADDAARLRQQWIDASKRVGRQQAGAALEFGAHSRIQPADGSDDAAGARQAVRQPDVNQDEAGREFTGFFSNITSGLTGKTNGTTHIPVLNTEPIAGFVREYNQHRGNFDDHIGASIPGFRELQTIVGSAIAKTYKHADMLDIGASEGALIKTISQQTGGAIRTVALDPNFAMAKHFNDGQQVPGSVYVTSAFGDQSQEGQEAWSEDATLTDRDGSQRPNPFAGQVVRYYQPDRQFDVVHEAMVFQFIDGNRAGQVARIKEIMKPDGVLILEEKFIAGVGLDASQFRASEAKKDAYKARYFTQAEIEAKARAVGVAEKVQFERAQQDKERAATGMNDLMVAPGVLEAVLQDNFKHVTQFWDSGNFKGYLSSDSRAALDNLLANMLPTDSEYATTSTPREVQYSSKDEYDYRAALAIKFERIRRFDSDRDAIMETVEAQAEQGFEPAVVLRLMAYTGFRVGGKPALSGKHEAFGATTLKPEHVRVDGDVVYFDFVGKASVTQKHSIQHAGIARDIAQRMDRERLFGVSDRGMRRYLDVITEGSDYKLHDWRTWSATDAARRVVRAAPLPQNAQDFWDLYDLAAQAAADKIGDTVKVALESYVEPTIFAEIRQSSGVHKGMPRGHRKPKTRHAAGDGASDARGVQPGAAEEKTQEVAQHSIRELGYYSELSAQIEKSTMKQAPAGAWKSFIKALSQKGVKADEVEWTGVLDWLDLQEGKVAKEALLGYLQANGAQVQEVVLGEGDWAVYDGDDNQYFGSKSEAIAYAKEQGINVTEDTVFRATDRPGGYGTKYENYTLPGGTNYREVLLTLPEKGRVDKEALHDEVDREYRRNGNSARYAELTRQLSDAKKALQSNAYKSGHWDQPNVLAHIRLNDRVDADGNRVLFVEEIQSDWGQEGKKQGFGITKRWTTVDGNGNVRGDFETKEQAQTFLDNPPDHMVALMDGGRVKETADGGVPTAPFVAKTEGWLNLALKRVIKMAVDGGYDKVAFVNGEQSAERYSLRGKIDTLLFDSSDGNVIGRKDGSNIITKSVNHSSEIADIVGKEVAERLLAAPKNQYGMQEISGLDLEVGGKGMLTFYDSIVPNAVNALLKKLGGGKMGVVDVLGEHARDESGMPSMRPQRLAQPGFPITDALRAKVGDGMPLFSKRDAELIEAKARLVPAVPETPKARKFAGKKAVVQVKIEDTGEVASLTMDVNQTLDDYDERTANMQKLLECLS